MEREKAQTLGGRILEQIRRRGMTQRSFADTIGMTESTVSHYVHDQRCPKASVLLRIARALDVTADYLLFGEGEGGGSLPAKSQELIKTPQEVK